MRMKTRVLASSRPSRVATSFSKVRTLKTAFAEGGSFLTISERWKSFKKERNERASMERTNRFWRLNSDCFSY